MKITIETEDKSEAIKLLKADSMAAFIWELVHNGWREFKHTNYEYEKAWNKIRELLEEYNIDIDEIINE
jgi:hypothetical protein